MKIDHSLDTEHQKWINSFGGRFDRLLRTGHFRIRKRKLFSEIRVPERLVALSSGLMRESRSTGRIGITHEFRIELLNEQDQILVRKMFGKSLEWVTAVQVHQATGVARSTASRRCQRNAAQLVVARDLMRIIDGVIKYSARRLVERTRGHEAQLLPTAS